MILSLALLLGACCSSKSLVGTSWKLVSLYGKTIDRTNLPDTNSYTMTFAKDGDDMRVNGMGDANRFFGEVEFEGCDRVEFDDMGSTKMMSPNQQQEDKFLTMFREALKYELKDGKLTLTNGSEVIAVFEVK